MNGVGKKKMLGNINVIKIWLFVKMNKIDKPLVKIYQEKREKTQERRRKRSNISIDSTYIKRITRKYYEKSRSI